MPTKLSQKEALERIKLEHGNEYTYPDFVYFNTRSFLDAVCKKHGTFCQTFDAHVYSNTGCLKCYGNEIITTKSFIAKAKTIHGSRYSYRLSKYIDAFTKLIVICKKHGQFSVKPNHHIASEVGCPYCSGRKMTTEFFINNAKAIHGNRYIYKETVFVNHNEPLKIGCRTHGIFWSKPKVHLLKNDTAHKCPKCVVQAMTMSLTEFLKRACKIHGNKYDYSLVHKTYISCSKSKIGIKCKRHGIFY